VRLRRSAWRWRHAIAALALALAASVAIGELRPPPPETTSVVAVDSALPAGHVIEAGDLRAQPLPPEAVPGTAVTDAESVIGRRLAVGLSDGTVLTPGMLAETALATPAAEGEVVVTARLADDGSAELARTGARVTLVAPEPDGGGARTVAEDVLVLGVVEPESGGLIGGAERDFTQIYLSSPPDTATVIIGSSAWSPLSVIRGPD
jgi:Flp pilus assembly protein CpaB